VATPRPPPRLAPLKSYRIPLISKAMRGLPRRPSERPCRQCPGALVPRWRTRRDRPDRLDERCL